MKAKADQIPRSKLPLCRAVLAELDEGLLSKLIDETREYPVEFCFAGYRFVFLCEQDIRDMIAWLRAATESEVQ